MMHLENLPNWQRSTWNLFAGQRARAQVPHALLLSASPGMGLHDFSQHIIASLLCTQNNAGAACGACRSCISFAAQTHPDLYRIEPAKDRASIGVDAIRELSGQLAMTPQAGEYQVAVIEPAEIMTREAANALLKTLEEPAEQTVLILMSEQAGRLMPTILSRCQRLRLAQPDLQSVREWLGSYSKDQNAIQLAIELAAGAPQRAAEILSDGSLPAYREFCGQLARLGQAEFDRVSFAKTSAQNLSQFCDFYQQQLLSAQRQANHARAQNPTQILAIAEIDRQLQRLRYWPGTGIRIDLAVLRLLDMHAHAIS